MKVQNNYILLFAILSLFYLASCNNSTGRIEPLKESWEKAVPHQEIPEGLASLSSEHCGACHQSHYNEWKISTHAHAWTDQQFQAELKKESSPFMCINCHIPLQNQQEYIVTGLVDGDIYQPVKELNPNFDKALQQEGINCAACHVRNNAVIGPTGTSKAPHKTIKDPDFLSEKLCLSCHNVTAVVTETLHCTFETGDEWKAGPYFETKNCISCHMDTIKREIVPGYAPRQSHLHYFSGSGIPKTIYDSTTMLNGLSYEPSVLNQEYAVGKSLLFSLKVKNEFAGHKVPTGDPERFILIEFILTNSKGEELKKTTNRIGEVWEWYPKAKKISDNNFLPGEERTYEFDYEPREKGYLNLQVAITKHRLNQESADYNGLTETYPLYDTIYSKYYPIQVK